MIKNLFCVIVLVVFTSQLSFGQCANSSNIYSFTYAGKNYEIVKEQKNWADAAACAIERGGYLVQIDSQAEQDSIYDAIINGAGISTTYTTVNDGGGIAYVWIGGSDVATEGTWVWHGSGDHFWSGQGAAGSGGGSAVGGLYNNWGGTAAGTPNEPDNYMSNQDGCAIALNGWPGGSGSLGIASEWNDISASNTLYFVIEMNSVDIDENEKAHPEIYPNPASESVEIKAEGNAQLFLYQITGQLIHSSEFTDNTSIDLNDYAEGIYLVKIVSEDQSVFTQKLIVQ